MNTTLWTSFVKRITVDAEPAAIYDALTTSDGIESWFLRSAVFTFGNGTIRETDERVQTGDLYEWRWFGHPDYVANGAVLDIDKSSFKFTFEGCSVTITVVTGHEIPIVELRQDDIPVDDNPETNLYVGCGTGWTFYLANLKSILEGGVDLRNKSDAIRDVINS